MSKRGSIDVQLAPDLEQFAHAQVSEGRYQSVDEVLADALRLLQRRERLRAAARQRIRDQVAEGAADFERGEFTDGEEFFRELLEETRRGRRAARP